MKSNAVTAYAGNEHAQTILLDAVGKEPRVDSRVIAENIHVQHKNVISLIRGHLPDFEQFGWVAFETRTLETAGGKQKQEVALLTEDQAYLLLTYSRNTPRVRELKIKLIKAFGEARRLHDLNTTEYLPTYHALHDAIHDKAAKSSNVSRIHSNFNRLINKVVGCESGQRGSLQLGQKSMMVVAQQVATNAMQGSVDHHDGYAAAKTCLQALALAVEGQKVHQIGKAGG